MLTTISLMLALVLVAVAVAQRATLDRASAATPNVHITSPDGVNVKNAPGGTTGNTFTVEITDVSPDLKRYSVVAEYDPAVIAVTLVTDTSGLPSKLCPGNSTTDGGGLNTDLGPRVGFESTCGTSATTGLPTGPTVTLFTVTFSCVADGSSPISFDSAPGYTLAQADSSVADLGATHTNGTVNCMPPPTSTSTPAPTSTPTPPSTSTPTLLTPTATSTSVPDTDGDGLPDPTELLLGTNPNNPDTDGDGLSDGAEVLTYLTDPLNPDTDADGLTDGSEINLYGTNPRVADTDGDGLKDGEEILLGTNPLNPDTDGDGVHDGVEVHVFFTNPLSPDTDGDGLGDAQEILLGTNPNNPDTDGDGLTDGAEINTYGTEPLLFDTDGDGLGDGAEINTYGTNPRVADTDGDGMPDGYEIVNTCLNPKVNDAAGDPDGDAVGSLAEKNQGTLPCNPDTDGDGFKDKPATARDTINTNANVDNCILAFNPSQLNSDGEQQVVSNGGPSFVDATNPNSDAQGDACDTDDDNDGRSDLAEASGSGCSAPTNILSRDSDGDHINDTYECAVGTNPNSAASRPVIPAGPNSDGDLLPDNVELAGYGTSPTSNDTDGDGCRDDIETVSLNNDRKVEAGDFAIMLDSWNSHTKLLADYDLSGKVEAGDFALLNRLWNQSCP